MKPYKVSVEMQERYLREGYLRIPKVVGAGSLSTLARELRVQMRTLNPNQKPLEKRSTYKKAFNQVTNLWQKSKPIQDFVFRQDLARLAADVMGVSGVRLYHDQALFKEAGGGATPWHVDQVYWPMDTVKTCTFWIPLQDTPREMGTLSFAKGSHLRSEGRDMVISDESEAFFSNWVNRSGMEVSDDDFKLGDISVHSGWTVHHAGPNKTDVDREVMTIIYMAADTRLLDKPSKTQWVDRDAFTPEVKPGELINTALNPILYAR